MKVYTLNLVTDTKNVDIYDKVALNKFPIVVHCKSEADLKEMLSGEEVIGWVQGVVKSQRTFDASFWMIRDIYPDGEVRELVWKVSDLITIDYSHKNI